jgi:curli biogenesis system outer membrane secretion channel CsgG
MKRMICTWTLLFLLLPAACHAKEDKAPEMEPFPMPQRYLMAVMPFEDKTKDQKYAYLGNQIADQLINEIFPYGRYRIIEREKLTAIIAEMQVQQTDYFKKDFISRIGNQLGAELMLVGSIIEVSQNTEKKSLGLMAKEETHLTVSLEARVIRIETGEILAIAKWSGKETSAKKRALVAVTDDARSDEDLLTEAVRRGIAELTETICTDAPKKDAPREKPEAPD